MYIPSVPSPPLVQNYDATPLPIPFEPASGHGADVQPQSQPVPERPSEAGSDQRLTLPKEDNSNRHKRRTTLRERRVAKSPSTSKVPNRGDLNSSARTTAPRYSASLRPMLHSSQRPTRSDTQPNSSSVPNVSDSVSQSAMSDTPAPSVVPNNSSPLSNSPAPTLSDIFIFPGETAESAAMNVHPHDNSRPFDAQENQNMTGLVNETTSAPQPPDPTPSGNRIHTNSLHHASMNSANQGRQNGLKRFDLLITANSESCLARMLNAIFYPETSASISGLRSVSSHSPFNTEQSEQGAVGGASSDLTYDGQVHWTRTHGNNQTSAMASVNAQQLLRSAGTAVTQPCVTGLSAEPAHTLNGRQLIEQDARRREQRERVRNIFEGNSDRVCVRSEFIDGEINPNYDFTCRQRAEYHRPYLTLSQRHYYETHCIPHAHLIGDGIDGNRPIGDMVSDTTQPTCRIHTSDAGVTNLRTTQGAQPVEQLPGRVNLGTGLAETMGRVCPTTIFSDVRMAQNIETSGINSTILTSQNLIQALDSVLQSVAAAYSFQSFSALLEQMSLGWSFPDGNVTIGNVIIYEVHEIPEYHPDIRLIQILVEYLNDLGVRVFAYASSPGSYLQHIKGIIHTSNVVELVQAITPQPRQRGIGIGLGLSFVALAGGAVLARYYFTHRGNNASSNANLTSESIEMTVPLQTDEAPINSAALAPLLLEEDQQDCEQKASKDETNRATNDRAYQERTRRKRKKKSRCKRN